MVRMFLQPVRHVHHLPITEDMARTLMVHLYIKSEETCEFRSWHHHADTSEGVDARCYLDKIGKEIKFVCGGILKGFKVRCHMALRESYVQCLVIAVVI